LRYTIRRVQLDEEEETRLRKEQALEGSFVGRIRRVLVPVRPGIESPGFTREMQAALLRQLGELQEMSITLMAVTTAEQRSITQRQLGQLKEIFVGDDVATRAVVSDDPVAAILREAESDYDLMVLGTPTARANRQSLFSEIIDDLVKLAPCPTMLDEVVDDLAEEALARSSTTSSSWPPAPRCWCEVWPTTRTGGPGGSWCRSTAPPPPDGRRSWRSPWPTRTSR